jgi:hypothetical protein
MLWLCWKYLYVCLKGEAMIFTQTAHPNLLMYLKFDKQNVCCIWFWKMGVLTKILEIPGYDPKAWVFVKMYISIQYFIPGTMCIRPNWFNTKNPNLIHELFHTVYLKVFEENYPDVHCKWLKKNCVVKKHAVHIAFSVVVIILCMIWTTWQINGYMYSQYKVRVNLIDSW